MTRSEWRSWFWVVAWSLAIFATIPLARTIEGFARAQLGDKVFGWLAIGSIVAGALVCCLAVARQRRQQPQRGSLAWLIGIAGVFGAAIASLWSNPEEAMHFVQYGVLALLLHRALAHRIRDRSIYLVAALVGTGIGCLDEAIQWVTPLRYFGLRDIGLNMFAGILTQLAIAKGLDPDYIEPVFRRPGLRAGARVAAAIWLLLLAFVMNTPARVNAYADRIPLLAFLADNPSTMLEYGVLHRDPAIGTFRSRLSSKALRDLDEQRGRRVGEIVASWEGSYSDYLREYPAQRDPYAHEFRVHLFRRDAHLVHRERSEGAARVHHAVIVAGEDAVLRRYFPTAFAFAGVELDPALQQEIAQEAEAGPAYASPVSGDLVTGFREWHILTAFVAGLIALLGVDRALSGPRSARG